MIISVLCDSCRVCRCMVETSTRARTLFAWAEDVSIKCSDYEPNFYQGVEGCEYVASMAGVYGGVFHRRRGGRYVSGSSGCGEGR